MENFLQKKEVLSIDLMAFMLSFFRFFKEGLTTLKSTTFSTFLFKNKLLNNGTLIMILFSFLLFFSNNSWSQSTSIWNNPITGSNPGQQNPYTTGDVKSPYITVSGIGETGLNGQNGNNRYNVDGFSTSNSINTSTDYFSFIITPNTGYHINFNSFEYSATRQTGGSGGPTLYSFRSSATSYGTSIGSPNSTGTTLSLTNSSYQNIDATIQFRFYGWDSGNSNGDFSIDDFDFKGGILGTSVTNLSNFSTCNGTSGTAQSFVVNGEGLSTSTATITVAGTTNYEVSKTSATSGFASSVTFNASGGSVSQMIWVRLKSTSSSGSYTESIVVSGGGFTTANGIAVSCSGSVNSLPSSGSVSSSSYAICNGNSISLMSNATSNSSTSVTLIDEGFNSPTNSWTTINSSTGGTIAAAAWTLRGDGYVTDSRAFNSNDASQFYLSNSDAQGSGSTTETILQSPVFNTMGMTSLSLNYFHYYEYNSGTSDRARVEVSTNGTSWSAISTYSSDQGSSANFSSVTSSLNSYINQPTVYLRFRYSATWDYYWAIDNVKVSGIYAAPPAPMYSWTSTPSGFSSSLQNPTNVMPSVTTTYTVTITNSYGCSISLTTPTVVVNQNPTISTVTQMATVCEGSSATFNLAGLLPNTTSSITYAINGNSSQTAIGVISNGAGEASFTATLNLVDHNQNIVLTNITRTDVTPSCPITVNVLNVLSVNQNITYYRDSDNDGFGDPLITEVSCVGAPVGFVTNNLDCNDADAFYNPNTIWYADTDNDSFGDLNTTIQSCTQLAGYVLDNTDCNDNDNTIYPGATEICFDGILQNCNGTLIDGCAPVLVNMIPSYCGGTLPFIFSTVGAYQPDLPSGTSETGYRFFIKNLTTGAERELERPIRNFNLTMTDIYEYSTTYQVRVAVRVNAEWQPYGAICLMTTPPIPTTQVVASQCGTTLPLLASTIGANSVNSANLYRFRVVNAANASEVQTIERSLATLKLTQLTQYPVNYNTTYNISVQVRVVIDGNEVWSNYGSVCAITTPTFPTTQVQLSQCETVASSNAEVIYADNYPNTTTYRFKLTNASLSYSQTVDRPQRNFSLSMFTGLQAGTTYTVAVSIKLDGVFGPYGKDCEITTPAALTRPVTKVQDDSKTQFSVVAFPNPFTNTFALDVKTSSSEEVNVSVYDMTGRLLEFSTAKAEDLLDYNLGDRYPSGVYNIVVTQDAEVKTVRVVKQ